MSDKNGCLVRERIIGDKFWPISTNLLMLVHGGQHFVNERCCHSFFHPLLATFARLLCLLRFASLWLQLSDCGLLLNKRMNNTYVTVEALRHKIRMKGAMALPVVYYHILQQHITWPPLATWSEFGHILVIDQFYCFDFPFSFVLNVNLNPNRWPNIMLMPSVVDIVSRPLGQSSCRIQKTYK